MEASATTMDYNAYLNDTMQLDVDLAPLTNIAGEMEFVDTVLYARGEDRHAREEAEYEYHHKRGHNVFDTDDIVSYEVLMTRPTKPLPKRGRAQQSPVPNKEDQANGVSHGFERLTIREEVIAQGSPNTDSGECGAPAQCATQIQGQTSDHGPYPPTDAKEAYTPERTSDEVVGNAGDDQSAHQVHEVNTATISEKIDIPTHGIEDRRSGTFPPGIPGEENATAGDLTSQTWTSPQLPDTITSALLAKLSTQVLAIIANSGAGNHSSHPSQQDIAIIRQLESHLASITAGSTRKSAAQSTQPVMARQLSRPPAIATTHHYQYAEARSSSPTSDTGYPIPPAIWPPIVSLGAFTMAPPQLTSSNSVAVPTAYPYGPFAPHGRVI